MAVRPGLRVLFFDVFGTCVAQRKPVADELWNAAKKALESDASSISSEVRTKATKMSYDDWFELGGEWNTEEHKFVSGSIEKHGNVDWRAVDKNRIKLLFTLLAKRGVVILNDDDTTATSAPSVKDGSLFSSSQLQHLGRVWHRLTPWPDTNHGLSLLNTKYSTVTLSNTYDDLIKSLVAYSSMPFTHCYSGETFQSYKPNHKVYLGAAEKLGVKPEECALVAAHLGDLKAAKECGFFAIYVERPLEEKAPELKKENIPDLVVKEDEEGLVKVAELLGIQDG